MTIRMGRPMILTAMAALASACAIDIGEEGVSGAEAVRRNAALALEQCGQGNVAAVDTDGFTCKAAE